MTYRRRSAGVLACAVVALVCCAAAAQQRPGQIALPNKPNTLHFAVIGDNGTGEQAGVRHRRADAELVTTVSSSRWS